MSYIPGMTTDRVFSDIDSRFALNLWDVMRDYLKKRWKITVIDIACGPDWRAIKDIVWSARWKINGIWIDFYLNEQVALPNLLLKEGDLFELPPEIYWLSDVTYCAYILPKLAFDFELYWSRLAEALLQISHTLRPGWIAFVDEWIYSWDYICNSRNLVQLRMLMENISKKYNQIFSLENNPTLSPNWNYLLIKRKMQ